MDASVWDKETNKRLRAVWEWILNPKRKPASMTWTSGGERYIGYLIEFAESQARRCYCESCKKVKDRPRLKGR